MGLGGWKDEAGTGGVDIKRSDWPSELMLHGRGKGGMLGEGLERKGREMGEMMYCWARMLNGETPGL